MSSTKMFGSHLTAFLRLTSLIENFGPQNPFTCRFHTIRKLRPMRRVPALRLVLSSCPSRSTSVALSPTWLPNVQTLRVATSWFVNKLVKHDIGRLSSMGNLSPRPTSDSHIPSTITRDQDLAAPKAKPIGEYQWRRGSMDIRYAGITKLSNPSGSEYVHPGFTSMTLNYVNEGGPHGP